MSEFAVFTEEVAMGLMARGFELVAQTEKAWFFNDSVLLEAAVSELVESIKGVDR
jgi:hypothetical protein